MFKNSLMLSLFGGFVNAFEKMLWISLAIVIVGLIGFFLIKSQGFRKFCLAFLCFVIMFGGVVSGVSLNKYYNTSGGIIGKLSQVLNPNAVEIDNRDEIEFNFKSIMLEQVDGDKYRAEFSTADYIELAPNEAYAVFVNDAPCELIEYGEDYTSDAISSDYIISEFYYSFYDEQLEFVLKDKLTFRFAFYKNSTKLIVETYGGSNAVALWNSYFQKNDFVVKIKPMENVYMSSYSLVKILDGDEYISSIKVKNGSVFVLPDVLEKPNYNFIGYSLDGVNLLIDYELLISEDLIIYAMFESKIFNVLVSLGGGSLTYSGVDYISDFYISISYDDKVFLNDPIKESYEFLYWKAVIVIDNTAYLFHLNRRYLCILEIVDAYNNSNNVNEENRVYIKDVSSVSLIAYYSKLAVDPTDLSDYEIQKYLIDNHFGSSMEICSTSDEFVRDIYLNTTSDRELYDNGSIYEIMSSLSSVYNIEVSEQTTARDFLNELYNLVYNGELD